MKENSGKNWLKGLNFHSISDRLPIKRERPQTAKNTEEARNAKFFVEESHELSLLREDLRALVMEENMLDDKIAGIEKNLRDLKKKYETEPDDDLAEQIDEAVDEENYLRQERLEIQQQIFTMTVGSNDKDLVDQIESYANFKMKRNGLMGKGTSQDN